jgi:hypothetical protein
MTDVREEQGLPFAPRNRPELKMDIVIGGGQGFLCPGELPTHPTQGSRGVMIDVKMSDCTCQSHIQHKEDASAVALQDMIQQNYSTYRGTFDPASYYHTQLAVDVFGYTHPVSVKLLKAFARHESVKSGGAKTYSYCLRRWRQLVSVTVQRDTSATVDRVWSRAVVENATIFSVAKYRKRLFLCAPLLGAGV